MKKIVFFNQFHNGDCFVGKQYVREIMRQLPGVEFAYAHDNNAAIISDLGCEHLTLDQIPVIDRMTRVAEGDNGDTIYINTWVGCWQGQMFPFGEHINFQRLHNIWREYFTYLKLEFEDGNPDHYLPTIDFSKYDIETAKQWAVEHAKYVLICNGSADSGQSGVGDLHRAIDLLSERLPNYHFLVTQKLPYNKPNIVYTADIFHLESDLNQIAYISQWSELIVGKNSGPFTWCQHRDNLLNSNRMFLNLSKLPTDCPSGGGAYMARCLFSPHTDDNHIANLIENILLHPEYRGTEILL